MTDRQKAIIAEAERRLDDSARFLASAEKDSEPKEITACGHAVWSDTQALTAVYELCFDIFSDEAERRSSIYQEYTLNNWRRYYGLKEQPVWKSF